MVQEITKIRFWIIFNPFYILVLLLLTHRVSLCVSLRYEGHFAAVVRAGFSQVSVGAGVRPLGRSGRGRRARVCQVRTTILCVEAQDDADGMRHFLRKMNNSSDTRPTSTLIKPHSFRVLSVTVRFSAEPNRQMTRPSGPLNQLY